VIYGMYLSTGGAVGEAHRADVIANNLANASTPGFRPQTASFREVLSEAAARRGAGGGGGGGVDQLGGGVRMVETATIDRAGAIVQTGRPLDLAIRGEGYFAVEEAGRVVYTRNGSFVLSSSGQIVTPDGRGRLMGAGGPVTLPNADVKVSLDGVITGKTAEGETEEYGRLAVWRFGEGELTRAGGGFVPRSGASPAASRSEVIQGSVELAAVEPVREMTDLIEAFRAFEANMQFIRIQDQTLARAASDIARLPG